MPLFFALTLFVSALLLFFIEPLVGKLLLPLMGGTPAVWNTCLVFFQIALLGGYLYAHAITTRLTVSRQVFIHLGLLGLTIVSLVVMAVVAGTPVAMFQALAPQGSSMPVPGMLLLLTLSIGLPFFAVSTSAPLLQKWFADTGHPSARDPYFLYAASNAGSLIALLAYPFLLEPKLRLMMQGWVWAGGFLALGALTAGCGMAALLGPPKLPELRPTSRPPVVDPAPSMLHRLHWLALAAVPSSLLMGVTTYITTDIAAIPLLWVLPLALYLITFIVAFSRLPAMVHTVVTHTAPVVLLVLVFLLVSGTKPKFTINLGIHLAAFTMAALVCHGELARRRPGTTYLTEFYLWMSAGGVVGGLFNALLAPSVFPTLLEYPIAVVAACLLVPVLGQLKSDRLHSFLDGAVPSLVFVVTYAVAGAYEERYFLDNTETAWFAVGSRELKLDWFASKLGVSPGGLGKVLVYGLPAMVCYVCVERPLRFGLCVAGLFLAAGLREDDGSMVHRERSFFGVLKVEDSYEDPPLYRRLVHGTTLHGKQRLQDPRDVPLTYYHKDGPVGAIFDAFSGENKNKEVAVVGLGTGSIAAYGEPGMRITFYEIDPAVLRIASDPRFFTFLSDTKAEKRIVLGDARVQLERDADARYGLMLVDAFSSDAIPVHLLTKEAVQLYFDRLEPDGVLAVHVSNRYLRLEPVVGAIARDLGLVARTFSDDEDDSTGKSGSTWIVLARKTADLGKIATDTGTKEKPRWQQTETSPSVPAWTDDFSNILSVFNWR